MLGCKEIGMGSLDKPLDTPFERFGCSGGMSGGGAIGAPRSGDIECHGALASESEWQMVRAAAVTVASQAAFTGYATDSFGPWQICAQRQTLATWPPGGAVLRVSVLQHHRLLQHWQADLPAVAYIGAAS
jgi:hypothetical protein